MDIIEIQTLVDITQTKATRPIHGTQHEIDQNRNFITLMQCVELRSIVSYETGPTSEKVDITKNSDFGSAYKGKQMVWTFRFSPDRSDVYDDGSGNKVASLVNDLHGVPVIKNLSETINIDTAIFNCTDDKYKNTIIKALRGTI